MRRFIDTDNLTIENRVAADWGSAARRLVASKRRVPHSETDRDERIDYVNVR